jgi:beta-glucosidase
MPEPLPYQDASVDMDERVEDLLARMTLEEKVGQLCQVDFRRQPTELLEEQHVGSFLFVLGQDTVDLQERAEKTRLGIPLIFGMDCIHGHALYPGGTVFPMQIAMASAWNADLVEEVGRVTATEAAATGVHWTFSPVCGVARDTRWGRVDETFGEDPYLNGVLVAAIVRGYQGDDLSDPGSIIACAKHYAGYSETQGGRDASEADLSRRKLLSCFLPVFEEAVKAGCATIMTGYQAIDGVPCTANHWLMTEVLRDRWGFEGFVVTDYDNVGRMHWQQMVCPDLVEAATLAVEAGNDMMMATPGFYDACLEAVRSGRLAEEPVDRSVRRILRIKFAKGLFDGNRYPDLERAQTLVACPEHRKLALEAACESAVLLKNDGNLLPLDASELKRIAVIGPNADDPRAQLGDWSLGSAVYGKKETHPREHVVTILDGIRDRAGGSCEVEYCRGCGVKDPEDRDIEEAAEAARRADVAVCVLGDDVSLNGEFRDRAVLQLTGAQEELLGAVLATGTPVVLVLVNGKPLCIPGAVESIPAILEAWNPGVEGGRAVAQILFGDRNPSGKLTVSWPRHVGQLPVYYNQIPGWHIDKYADLTAEPLFRFGHGLSYTVFEYSDLRLSTDELRADETLVVEVNVENTGNRAGVEIVQLYVNDRYSSVTTPVKELKAFARIALDPAQVATVRLEVPCTRLALVNADLQRVVEPGESELMVGPSSDDAALLRAAFRVVGEGQISVTGQ